MFYHKSYLTLHDASTFADRLPQPGIRSQYDMKYDSICIKYLKMTNQRDEEFRVVARDAST